ncbi:MAG: porin family protein [bacterium]|nr:porin family protein [bacterium]
MKRLIATAMILTTALLLTHCASGGKKARMTRTYFEYSRGKSFPTHSDLGIRFKNHDYTLHGVYFEDESFFEDNSIIPNAFLKPLFSLKFNDAQKAFTEPYYSYRFIHFLKKNPHIGIGLEFIHLKVFILDKDQRVRMSGIYKGEPIDETVRIGDYIDQFNISHGVNHVGLHLVYRWMFKKTPRIPDGKWQPYTALSIGPTFPHIELDVIEDGIKEKGAFSYQGSKRNWGFGLGAGVRYKPWRRFGFYLEYKLTYSNLKGMRFDDMEDTNVSMAFSTHQIQWGLSLMF